jgi:hypothetical protein
VKANDIQTNRAGRDLARLANDILGALSAQFPVCVASDEFHFFPQARADHPDWSRWDDFSPSALADVIARLFQGQRRLEQLLSTAMPPDQIVDADMLRRVVCTLGEQLAHAGVVETQPTFYLTIVGIGLAEALESGRPALGARLRSLPEFLDQARRNIVRLPRRFRDLGLDMLAKQQHWVASLPAPQDRRTAVNDAYRRLKRHLRQTASVCEDFLPPVDWYAHIAADHMGCQCQPDEIARELAAEIAETRSILEASAATMAPGQAWQTVVASLKRPPMPAGGIGVLYQNTIIELARHCRTKGITTARLAQCCPVAVEPIPDYMRPVRSNAAFSMPPGHPPHGGTFYIFETGSEASIPADYRMLTAHETFPGHHLLDTCRWDHPRPIRRHIEFPIFYEGWASFAEELMFDTGFFAGPIERMLMAKRRFWRAMRGRVDLDIHMRRRTPDQAVADLTAAGLAANRAKAMIDRYCLKPGYQLAYTMGRRRFRRLFDNFSARQAGPADFARRVLAQGEIGFDHLQQVLEQGG